MLKNIICIIVFIRSRCTEVVYIHFNWYFHSPSILSIIIRPPEGFRNYVFVRLWRWGWFWDRDRIWFWGRCW